MLVASAYAASTAEYAVADGGYTNWSRPAWSPPRYQSRPHYDYDGQNVVESGWRPGWRPSFGGTNQNQLRHAVERLTSEVEELRDDASRGFSVNRAPRNVRRAIGELSSRVRNLNERLRDDRSCSPYELERAVGLVEQSATEVDRALYWSDDRSRQLRNQWERTRRQLYRVASLTRAGSRYEYRK